MAKNNKKLSVMPYLPKPYFIWFSFMVHMCKGIISPGRCYVFPDFIFLGLNSAVKRQKKWLKITKNHLSYFISQDAYIIWSSFSVHMCKMMTSPDAFFIFTNLFFSKFWFFCFLGWRGAGVKGQKMSLNY